MCQLCKKPNFSDGYCIDHWDCDKFKVNPDHEKAFDSWLDKIGKQEQTWISKGKCGSCGKKLNSKNSAYNRNYCAKCDHEMNVWASWNFSKTTKSN